MWFVNLSATQRRCTHLFSMPQTQYLSSYIPSSQPSLYPTIPWLVLYSLKSLWRISSICQMSCLITPIHTALFLHFSPLLLASFSWVVIFVESSRDFKIFQQVSFVVLFTFTFVVKNPETCSFSMLAGSSCKDFLKVVSDFFITFNWTHFNFFLKLWHSLLASSIFSAFTLSNIACINRLS